MCIQVTSDVACLETYKNIKPFNLQPLVSHRRIFPHQAELRLHWSISLASAFSTVFSQKRFALLLKTGIVNVHLPLTSYTGVFREARLSSLPTRDERRAPPTLDILPSSLDNIPSILGWCLENWEGPGEHQRTAESSQRPSIKIIQAYIINNDVSARVSDSTVICHRHHTILLLERIPHFNFPNSVIHDQVPFPDLLRTTKRFLWLLWPLPAIFSSSWRKFSPSLIALNPLSSAFHQRIKGSG